MAAVKVMDVKVMDAAHPSLLLKVASHSSHLALGLVALWKAGELCDYVIKGTDESFSIHSPVLAALSPVFKSMLTSDMKESAKRGGACKFPEITDAIVKKIVEAAYTGRCSVAREELVPLIVAAHYLGMSTLLKACEKIIPKILCPSDYFSWIRIAKTYELDTLVPCIQALMLTSHDEVIQSDEFFEAAGAEVSEYLKYLVQHNIHSDRALAAAVQWIERDAESRAVHMPELFLGASVADCTRSFLQQVMREKSDIIDLQQNMHKLILELILDKDSVPPTNLLILGGQGDNLDVNTDIWILKDDHLVKYAAGPDEELKLGHSICQVPQGVMVTGGDGSTMCKLFDTAKITWVDKASLLTERYSHGSGCVDSIVFAIGGVVGIGNDWSNSVDWLDLTVNTWQRGPDLPVIPVFNRPLHVAVCNSMLYALKENDARLYCLDGANKAWIEKSGLPEEDAAGCSMVTVGGRMFVSGGSENINYMYIANADSWCRLSSPGLYDYYGSMVYHRKKLYLIAGCEINNQLTDVMEYDIGADTWAMSPWKLPKPLCRHAAFVVNVRL